MTQKYGVLVKTREDIEHERQERERILQEQYEEERLKRIEMDRIEREKNANKGMTIQINQGPNSNNPTISIMPNQAGNTKENYNSNVKKEELGLKEREENEPTEKPRKRLTIVDTPMTATNDQKLDNNLVDIYNKKRMSYVPVKKIADDNYQFGTQMINIKVDGETIRGI